MTRELGWSNKVNHGLITASEQVCPPESKTEYNPQPAVRQAGTQPLEFLRRGLESKTCSLAVRQAGTQPLECTAPRAPDHMTSSSFTPLRVPPAIYAGLPPHLRLGLLLTPQVAWLLASRRLTSGTGESGIGGAGSVRYQTRTRRAASIDNCCAKQFILAQRV